VELGTPGLPPCLDIGDRNLSPVVVGINTNLVIGTPGLGYTSGDTIQVGDTFYEPVLTENGSIIGVEFPPFILQGSENQSWTNTNNGSRRRNF
jgi:hypothetical protein